MELRLGKLLNIEREEISGVSILLFQSVFLGIFAGSFDVSAQSYFLEIFSADLIPKAFAWSGAVGIVITSIYSFFQSRIRFSVFAVLNLLFVAVITISLRVGFEFFNNENLVFAMFVLMGPLIIIAFLSFWGTVGRMFTLRQGKRLFGLIDTGQIMGIILASYAIPVLLSFNFEILNSLYICSGSMILALFIQIYISSKYSLKTRTVAAIRTRRSNFFDLFKKKYTSLMVAFVVLSVLAAFFIHYSFLVVTEENYPDATALASFLGVFMGTVMVFTLIIKTFVYARLMKTYGLKLALTLSPILLGIFVVGALIIGSVYGYSIGTAGFTFFFLLMVSGKLFSKSLKDSVEVPSSKILYQSLDADVRYDVQSRIDGTVNELAALSSGLLMAGLALIASFKLIHFSYVLGFILIIWAYLAFQLHKSYKSSLRESLSKFQKSTISKESFTGISELENVEELGPEEIESILQYAPQSWNGFISKNLKILLNKSQRIQSYTLEWIDKLNISEAKTGLSEIQADSDDNKKRVRRLLDRFSTTSGLMKKQGIAKWVESENSEDRLKAITYFEQNEDENNKVFLSVLIRDNHYGVRVSAIRLLGKLKYVDFSSRLIDLLTDRKYYSFAYQALDSMKHDIVDKLDHAFYRTSSSPVQMNRILRLICSIDSDEVLPFILNKLDQPEIEIHKMVLKKLAKMNYDPDLQYRQRLIEYLQTIIGIAAWNLSARLSLKEENNDSGLLDCFDQEVKDMTELVFDVLSVLYDTHTILQIKKNMQTGSSETIGYSLELIDLFVDENIKSSLFALLEDSTDTIKIAGLQIEYPVEILKMEDLLHSIINRDFNFINPYTRLLAIKELSVIENYSPGDDLVAQLFNPDDQIALLAAIQLSRFDNPKYNEVLSRLKPDKKEMIESKITNQPHEKVFPAITIIQMLRKSGKFETLSLFDLYKLSCIIKEKDLLKDEEYELNRFSEGNVMIYSDTGEISLLNKETNFFYTCYPSKFYSIPAIINTDMKNIKIKANQKCILLFVEIESYKELVFDNEETYLPVIQKISSTEPEKIKV
jgi:AAA family ATP:ADP antiporter